MKPLSPKQTQVIALAAEGLTDKEIALRVHRSAQTIRSHMRAVLQKLSARNRAHAAVLFDRSRTC